MVLTINDEGICVIGGTFKALCLYSAIAEKEEVKGSRPGLGKLSYFL